MKKQAVKVRPISKWGKDCFIFDYTEFCIGHIFDRKWLESYKKITITPTKSIEGNTAIIDLSISGNNGFHIEIKALGEFGDHIEPGSEDIFILELIEIDEREIVAFPELKDGEKCIMK